MEKIFKASLVEWAETEIISLQHESRGGRLPNVAVGNIINGVTSAALTMTKTMIMRKLTIMEKANKAAAVSPPQAQFLIPVRLQTPARAAEAAGYADSCASTVPKCVA